MRMQHMERSDYINERPRLRQNHSRDENKTERRLSRLFFLSFGIFCIIQATLNISLRLSLYYNEESSHLNCNRTQLSDQNQVKVVQDCEQKRPGQCNTLQERFNALTRDKNLLENRNTELNNMINNLEKENDRLQMMLRELRCPADWRYINSKCYFLSNEKRTWDNSRIYCQINGADLVVIESEQEQRALYRLDGDVDLLFWIGLHDTTGNFKWVDGSALNKLFWQSGQPDHGGPYYREDCVEMYHFKPVTANWNDAPCGNKRRWLCEKDPCETCN